MNKLIYFLLLVTPIFVTPSHAFTAEAVAPADVPSYFTHFWTGNESLKKIFFNITLEQGIEVQKTYRYIQFSNGQACEFTCNPQEGYKFETESGVLEELKVTVELSNTLDPKKINYVIKTECKFKKTGFFINTSTTLKRSSSGVLYTSSINLSERAELVLFADESNKAIVIFNQ